MRDKIERLTGAFLADMSRLIAQAVVEGVKRDTTRLRPKGLRKARKPLALPLKVKRIVVEDGAEGGELTVEQAAKALRVARGSVYQLIAKGLLTGRKEGKRRYFLRADVEAVARERGT
jgi:excisionase family DNA binding protein